MHIPEVRHLEDQQTESDQPVARPLRMAVRNAAVALFGIGALMFTLWGKIHLHGYTGPVYWWLWAAVAAFAVVVCFVHAFLAAKFGGRRAGNFLKVIVAIALAGMLATVWWSLQSKNGV